MTDPADRTEPSAAADLSPRVRHAVAHLRSRIIEGELPPGHRLPTLRDLARQIGVSYGVINSAIAHLQGVGQLETRPGSGTFVARQSHVVASAGGEVCMLIHGRQPGFAEYIEPIIIAIQDRGMTLRPVVYEHNDVAHLREQVESWCAQPPRAVILKGPPAPLLRAIGRRRLPPIRFITLYCVPDARIGRWHNVRPDETDAYYLAARYLVRQGHERLGLRVGRRTSAEQIDNANISLRPKVRGVQQAIHEADMKNGLSLHEQIVSPDDPHQLTLEPQQIDNLIAWLTGPDAPTAVIEKLQRLACIRVACEQAGLRFGEDVAVVGIGEPDIGDSVELPCVSENTTEIATQVVTLVADDDPAIDRTARHIIVRPRFIARKTFKRLSSM